MTGRTHLVIGVLSGVAIAKYGNVTPDAIVLAGLASGVGALLPDIDMPGSIISRFLFPLRIVVALFKVAHRGMTHSILALLMVALVCWLGFLARPEYSLYFLCFAIGYASHMIADMLTPAGIAIFWPAPIKVKMLPAALSRAASPVLDKLFFIGGIAVIGMISTNSDARDLERFIYMVVR